jgi:hypothetical protein
LSITIEGNVTGVMETFPLQLKVEANGVSHHVTLSDRTRVTFRGAAVDPGLIMPSTKVRIDGRGPAGGATALAAESIEIISA